MMALSQTGLRPVVKFSSHGNPRGLSSFTDQQYYYKYVLDFASSTGYVTRFLEMSIMGTLLHQLSELLPFGDSFFFHDVTPPFLNEATS